MARYKPPLDKETEKTLLDFLGTCLPMPDDHPFVTDVKGFNVEFKIAPESTDVSVEGVDHNVSGFAVAQLRNKQGDLCGLVHLGEGYHAKPTYENMVFAPKGFARGGLVIGDPNAPVYWLCETMADAWAILRNTTTPTKVLIYFQKRNLEYIVKAYKGDVLAIPSDPTDRMMMQPDYVDQRLVQVVTFPLRPSVALAFDVDITPVVDGHNNKYIRYLPHTPSVSGSSDPEFFGKWHSSDMLAHIYLIYGTDTCWDNLNRMQMRLSHLKHAVTTDVYKEWADNPARKTVKALVFDPFCNNPPNTINLFAGLPDLRSGIDPFAKTSCDLIVKHVRSLCGGRGDEFDYLIRWLAYPLQNLGAKMDSSVIMYGSEGFGKSILFEKVVGKIYGDYAVTIGQAQLESQFTGWQSSKLFALCEEVVSRAERSQHKGQLKHLVTGSTIMVNEKNLPLREESNHVNFVFLSNSTVPLELDMGDRRYLVLYNDKVPPAQYFKDLFAEIDNGGICAFYDYLMSVDLTGFDEHTRPPLNADKQHLIDASLPNPVLFFNEWRAGELDLPYSSCAKADLFTLYRRWCTARNEYPKRDRDVTAELRRYIKDDRKNIAYPTARDAVKTVRVWITDEDREMLINASDGVVRLQNKINRFALDVKPKTMDMTP